MLSRSPADAARTGHHRRVNVQDLGAVRRLSAWRSAVRELDEHVGDLTSFGPRAVDRVGGDLDVLELLEGRAHAAFCDLAAYLREHDTG
jgi:hypothetical protein